LLKGKKDNNRSLSSLQSIPQETDHRDIRRFGGEKKEELPSRKEY